MIALLLILAALALLVPMVAPRRHNRLPATEQFILSLLHIAAWIKRTGTAMDAGLVRYRVERRALTIQLDSTRGRTASAMERNT